MRKIEVKKTYEGKRRKKDGKERNFGKKMMA